MDEFRLETGRLVLRGWRDTDRAPFAALALDPEVMRYLPPLDRAQSDAVVDRMIAMQAGHGHCFWALERREDARLRGFCGVAPPRDPLREHEIGWRLERAAWGQGYAHEAAEATLAWAWRELAVPTIVAITVHDNRRSWSLMKRLGMVRMPDEDFEHPALPAGDPLRPHILYRIHRP